MILSAAFRVKSNRPREFRIGEKKSVSSWLLRQLSRRVVEPQLQRRLKLVM